jgi:tetratricopeptide (TPR) repeat protein
MLRKIKSFAVCLLGLGLFSIPSQLRAQARQDCYVIRADGTKLKGRVLTADNKGNLMLSVDDKLEMPFGVGSYRYGFIPKPAEVAALEKLFDEKNHAEVIKSAPAVFDKYKYLGWCYVIAALEAESHLAQGKINDARRVISSASRLGGEHRDKLNGAIVKLYIADKDFAKADAILKRQLRDADDSTAAQAFCLLGEMAEAQDDKKQAVLEYLKVLMLFDGKKAGEARTIAKSRALRLMREMKDPRVDKIAAYE